MADRVNPAREHVAAIVLVASATTLLVQSLRVFVSYLVFVIDQSNRAQIGSIVFVVFAAAALAPALHRALGIRRSLVISGALLVAARIGVQLVQQPTPRLILAALAVAGWGWLLISALESRPAPHGFGLVLGLALDLLLRIALLTIDLPWMPGLLDHLMTLALVAAFLVALSICAAAPIRAVPIGSRFALALVGPLLAAHILIPGNLGLAQVRYSANFAHAAAMLAAGASIGLLLASALGNGRRARRWPEAAAIVVVAAGAAAFLAYYRRPLGGDGASALLGVLATVGVSLALVLVLDGRPRLGRGRSRRVTLWFTIGLVIEAALLFAYYIGSGSEGVIVAAALLLLCAALACAPPREGPAAGRAARIGLAFAVAAVAVVGLRWITWSSPETGGPIAGSLTVMTWNLQSGFAADKRWDLERQARVIEAENPDVLILQEVSRGWLVTSYTDELLWLSRRLDMPYVWGPASDDDLWGNAILSRAPLSDVTLLKYASTQNLKRSAVRARLATATGDIWIVATHLDNPSGAGSVRMEQVNQLIRFRDGLQPALVAGDMNSDPDSDVVAALVTSGLIDTGATLGPGAVTSHDRRRIDYIFATPGLTLVEIHVVETDASDHRALVATFQLAPATADAQP